MRTTLLLSLLSVSFGLTALSLVMVRSSYQRQIRQEIISDLHRSTITFENLQAQRRVMLQREVALLADLPSLKALMTTDDIRTIQDGAAEFYRVSGSDFFALANRGGRIVARYEDGHLAGSADGGADLLGLITAAEGPRYVLHGNRLYEVSLEPLYFGSPVNGTLLGYVAIGYALDDRVARQVSEAAAADVVFSADNRIVSSTLDSKRLQEFARKRPEMRNGHAHDSTISLGSERFLVTSVQLSTSGAPVVQLDVLKSYDSAIQALNRLNQLLIGLGILVLMVGGVLALYISGTITRPLEALVAGARALGKGDFDHPLRGEGVRELRELSVAFDRMRLRLRQTQQELLEAERLATIGRMASSISHDLRHYLSAVYANAEFLGYPTTRPEERAELLAEVRLGVQGMTELIESLLLFSRTGQSMQISCESIQLLADRAITLVRTHPDALNVSIHSEVLPQMEVWVDARKIERAIYNLLLNGCHAAKLGKGPPLVTISLVETEEWIKLRIQDNGPGVPPSIRATLFQPFVSEGKQGGIGLGLTLANRIAQEHGGSVSLEESRSGKTVFTLSLSKSTLRTFQHMSVEQRAAAILSTK